MARSATPAPKRRGSSGNTLDPTKYILKYLYCDGGTKYSTNPFNLAMIKQLLKLEPAPGPDHQYGEREPVYIHPEDLLLIGFGEKSKDNALQMACAINWEELALYLVALDPKLLTPACRDHLKHSKPQLLTKLTERTSRKTVEQEEQDSRNAMKHSLDKAKEQERLLRTEWLAKLPQGITGYDHWRDVFSVEHRESAQEAYRAYRSLPPGEREKIYTYDISGTTWRAIEGSRPSPWGAPPPAAPAAPHPAPPTTAPAPAAEPTPCPWDQPPPLAPCPWGTPAAQSLGGSKETQLS